MFQDMHILGLVIRDIFGGLPDVPQVTLAPAALQEEIESVCEAKNLHMFQPWVDKCISLYTASLTNHG